ncbi:protein tyrosine phosphatase family protein [Roseateles oligotrophus]|uniref:TIGR01244 family phosphatase n=1 Tax=Roseateles oligotrophus TaxID=1769250 RepID=A0ABT2YL75_9BURK|nr:TIGR01244 family sulfur transferase [Roseateles oligotrophus]MCV2370752.1 TIGR01244 family phosphatase [Roseateles oligotrophus]
MSIPVRSVTPEFYVAAQLTPADMAGAAAMGFKTVINNRPDLEGGAEQPSSGSIQAAAEAAGLVYVHLPVVAGAITPEQAASMKQALDAALPPVLAFCRSGARSTQLFMLAQQVV